jgi:hypothetical protein
MPSNAPSWPCATSTNRVSPSTSPRWPRPLRYRASGSTASPNSETQSWPCASTHRGPIPPSPAASGPPQNPSAGASRLPWPNSTTFAGKTSNCETSSPGATANSEPEMHTNRPAQVHVNDMSSTQNVLPTQAPYTMAPGNAGYFCVKAQGLLLEDAPEWASRMFELGAAGSPWPDPAPDANSTGPPLQADTDLGPRRGHLFVTLSGRCRPLLTADDRHVLCLLCPARVLARAEPSRRGL